MDVVALARNVSSTRGRGPAEYPVSWDEIFSRVESKLRSAWRFGGSSIKRGDKCITVEGDGLSLDVVPAIRRSSVESDPIEIYSFREGTRRDNYPRTHFKNGAAKNERTDESFKPTVRMLKYWASRTLEKSVAPSFYIECAAHEVPDDRYNRFLPLSFAKVALTMIEWDRHQVVMSVAGDKDILTNEEWKESCFDEFKAELLPSVSLVLDAINASSQAEADRLWTKAFGG